MLPLVFMDTSLGSCQRLQRVLSLDDWDVVFSQNFFIYLQRSAVDVVGHTGLCTAMWFADAFRENPAPTAPDVVLGMLGPRLYISQRIACTDRGNATSLFATFGPTNRLLSLLRYTYSGRRR